MPSETKYSVDTRYTSREALEKKLQKIFPFETVAYFEIKVSNWRMT